MSSISTLTLPNNIEYDIKDATARAKLAGIEDGAQVNVQSDWNEADMTSASYILNKPTIPNPVTVDTSLSIASTNPVQNKIITTALSKKVDLERGIQIPDNSDLDDYTTIGNYYVAASSNAATITNTPVKYGFVLKVIQASPGNEYRIQLVIANASGYIYKRYYSPSSGWNDWQIYYPDVPLSTRNTSIVMSSSGSTSLPIKYGFGSDYTAMFLVTCGRYSVDTTNHTGFYIVRGYKNGTTLHHSVHNLKSASNVTVTCDGNKIDITTTTSFMAFSVLQVF